MPFLEVLQGVLADDDKVGSVVNIAVGIDAEVAKLLEENFLWRLCVRGYEELMGVEQILPRLKCGVGGQKMLQGEV